jgi:hypothetical protein
LSGRSSEISELENARAWFESWREPTVFSDRLSKIRPLLKRGEFLYVKEGKWYREAWALSAYSKFICPNAIRLNHDDPPDAFVKRGEIDTPIEITEVLEPGRKPSLFYKAKTPELILDPGEDWIKRAEAIPDALRSRLADKAKRAYTKGTELLVYLNIDELGVRQEEIESQLLSILPSSTGSFAMTHVIWKYKLFSSNGEIKAIPDPFEFEVDDDEDEEIFRSAVAD